MFAQKFFYRGFWLAAFFCTNLFAQDEAKTLQISQSVSREIAQNQVHTYKINAKSGEFARVVVRQKNVDVALRGVAPDGQKFIETDNSDNRFEPERLSFVADKTGEYKIEIAFVRNSKTPAEYEINLEILRASEAKDETRVRAERLYDKANQMRFSDDAQTRSAAVKIFQESLPLFVEAQDRFGEAFAHYALGDVLSLLSDLPQSQANYAKSAQIFRELNARPQLARALADEAKMHFFQYNLNKTIELSNESLKIFRETGDRLGEAEILGNFGVISEAVGQPRQALAYFEKVLPLMQAEGDRRGEARMLHSIGSVYDDLGEPLKSIEYYEKALAIRRAMNDKTPVANTSVNLASVLKAMGETQKAIELLTAAAEYYRTSGDRRAEAIALNNLGTASDDLGDYAQAVKFYEQSLQLNRELKLREQEARSLSNIAITSLKLNNADKALEFQEKALQIFRELKDKNAEAMLLTNISLSWQKKGNSPKASEGLQSALAIFRELENREWQAQALFQLGDNFYVGGDFAKAFENCSQALELNRAVKNRTGESVSLLCAAQAESGLGRLAEAQTKIESAISLIENSRGKLAREDLRASFFASKQNYYEFYIELLMRRHKAEPAKGFDALALQTSERARARNLLESLGSAGNEIRADVAPELVARERDLQQKINAKEVLRSQAINSKAKPEKTAEIEKEIDEAVRDLRDARAKIRAASPKFAGFSEPQPLELKEIQTQVLDDNSVLLEYALGTERSFLFVAAKNSLKVFELPPRAEIERAARSFYDSLKTRGLFPAGETFAQRQARIAKNDAEMQKASAELGKILIAPAAELIPGKRLLIVGTEVLQYIPFAALPSPQSKQDSRLKTQDSRLFLIETNEIVNLPSASAVAILRKSIEGRKQPPRQIAVFADPIFSGDDARLPAASTVRNSFARLKFTRQEAEKIAVFAPPENRFVATDFQASLANFRKQDLSQFRIWHFATHGTLDSRFPELSGVILSLVDEKGKSQDGFLRLSEIYNLRLNAKLVALSACETALGTEIRGEGLIGLSHGFMYAGAESVLASLWRVDDRATSVLMSRFYEKILKENLRPSEALQKAQISMIKEKGLDNPFYWSAFTLQGEWR